MPASATAASPVRECSCARCVNCRCSRTGASPSETRKAMLKQRGARVFPPICSPAATCNNSWNEYSVLRRLRHRPARDHRERESMLAVTNRLAGAVADDHKRRPESRERFLWVGGMIDQGQHGLAQRLGTVERWILAQAGEYVGRDPCRCFVVELPVRDQERARPGVEECPRQARQTVGARLVAGGGIAGGKHHPVRIELECGDLRGGQ